MTTPKEVAWREAWLAEARARWEMEDEKTAKDTETETKDHKKRLQLDAVSAAVGAAVGTVVAVVLGHFLGRK